MKKKIKRDDSIYFVHRSTVSLVFPFFAGNDDLSLTGEVSKEAIDFSQRRFWLLRISLKINWS